MKADVPMDSYAARLASFNATLTTQKKRASDAKGAKILKWPHEAPPASQLAKAGFFYQPTATNPDNATCYLCHCNLDGWEEEDEPVVEHLKHSPSCGWANIASIEQAVETGETDLQDPMAERLVDARIMTFGSTWPHESKRGWVCKIRKMVEAGWYYCPTLESDDFVRCAYCNLSLDGWEPKDNPYEEHQRRSPDCLFFSLSSSSQPTKVRKSKKGRKSRVSRASTQSRLSIASENASLEGHELQEDSIVSLAESVKPTKASKGRPKSKKVKAQALMPTQDDIQIGSSFIEPEDDDFEVKVAQPAASMAKGKKRKSGEMAGETETSNDSAPKKRRTTVRNSTASVQAAPDMYSETGQPGPGEDTSMKNPEGEIQPSQAVIKKGRKGSKKRGSVRKGPAKSTASEASLRAGMPDDEDIEAALVEDLDRPLTDNDKDEEPEPVRLPKGRKLTRSKLHSKATDASTAPTRRNTRNSIVTIDESVLEPNTATSASLDSQIQPAEDPQHVILQSLPTSKTKKKTGTRKVSAKEKAKGPEAKDVEELPAASTEEVDVVKSKQTRGRKPSKQVSMYDSRSSNISITHAEVDMEPKIDSSLLGVQTQEDDPGHETDATTNGRPKNGRKASTAKKTTRSTRAGHQSRNTEHVARPANALQPVVDARDTVAAPVEDVKEPEPPAKSLRKPAKKQNKAAKTGLKPKGKKTALKAAEDEEAAPDVDRSEDEVRVEMPSSPLAPPVHSTPRPAPSPQSSDAENQPPSSRPSQARPPLSFESPMQAQETRVPLAIISTPSASPSKGNLSKLHSTLPWTAMDIDQIFHGTPDAEKGNHFSKGGVNMLTSPEKRLTVEEWIKYNAEGGEEKLRNDCERLVGRFEDEGVRALKTLEGIVCID